MKKTLIVVLVILIAGFVVFKCSDEPAPVGNENAEAEVLTDKMFTAIGKEKWDSLAFIQWSFLDKNHYLWDKKNHRAEIKIGDNTVLMNLKSQKGIATANGKTLEGDAKEKALEDAWKNWCNDSFWLNAPAKARDAGTTRSIVEMEDGTDGLLVEYSSGGVTPGDSYLWAIDETGLPEYYKMWVSIIPVGGVEATWSDWKDFDGIKISTTHEIGPMNVNITNLKVGDTLGDMEREEGYFDIIG